jgi:hypothetical protein
MEEDMKNNKLVSRWYTLLGYIGMVGILLACSAIGVGSSNVAQGILQLEDGIIKVANQDGDLEPLAADSTFELVGTLESMDPWKVSGRALQRNEATQIAEGLEVGDVVRVRGAVLEDDAWLAYSIEPADEQATGNQTITMIGKVTSVDPWVVNGITLNVTDDTVINGEITTGMLARVEILLLDDGTWEVISISPAGDLIPTDGCVNVVATVESVTGDQVKFVGWPTTVTVGDNPTVDNDDNDNDNDNNNDGNDNENDGADITTLQPGQQVVAVICVSDDGQLVIVKIVVLDVDDDDDGDTSNNSEKVLVCHKPDKKGGHTLSIASAAVPAHMGHGDKMGACP